MQESTYNLNEAKTHLSRLLEAVQQGEEITITRYGVPVARLVPILPPEKRLLDFHSIAFESDLLEPTEDPLLKLFYPEDAS